MSTLTDLSTWTERLDTFRLRSFTDDEGHFWLEQNPANRNLTPENTAVEQETEHACFTRSPRPVLRVLPARLLGRLADSYPSDDENGNAVRFPAGWSAL
jgi:hypothetical protein